MAVSIRLSRQGSKKRPFYRVVAAEKTSPRDGRFIEQLGVYDPRAKLIRIDQERYAHWLGCGAKASETVISLAKRAVKLAEAAEQAASAKPAPKPASKPSSKPEVQAEAKPEVQAEAKPEVQAEAKPEAAVEAADPSKDTADSPSEQDPQA